MCGRFYLTYGSGWGIQSARSALSARTSSAVLLMRLRGGRPLVKSTRAATHQHCHLKPMGRSSSTAKCGPLGRCLEHIALPPRGQGKSERRKPDRGKGRKRL